MMKKKIDGKFYRYYVDENGFPIGHYMSFDEIS